MHMHFGVRRQRSASKRRRQFSIGLIPLAPPRIQRDSTPAGLFSMGCHLSRGTVLLSVMFTKEALHRVWEIPIPRPRRRSWGRGKSGVEVKRVCVLGATCERLRANRTNSACSSLSSLLLSHASTRDGVLAVGHVCACSRVAVVSCSNM
jgi:hypothetical protein